jgi:hypothetical protein
VDSHIGCFNHECASFHWILISLSVRDKLVKILFHFREV